MASKIIITCYRVLAGIIILLPMVLNIVLQGDIVTSLIYAPVTSLAAAVIANYYDEKIGNVLARHFRYRVNPYTRFLVRQMQRVQLRQCCVLN